MTVQWTLAAGFLYLEIGLLLLFCLPFISPSRWNKIFKSNFVSKIFSYGNFYFNVFVIIMIMLLADPIREIMKYNQKHINSIREIMKYNKVDITHMDLKNNPQAENLVHMKLFRAQRNLYISGFSLFLLIVLRRVVTLLSHLAVSEASAEASIKQAQGASDQCKKLMEENEKLQKRLQEGAGSGVEEISSEEVNKLKSDLEEKAKELEEKSEDLEKTKKDLTAFKEQAKGVSLEYDRLLEEHSKMQTQLNKGSEESKKDD